MGGGDDNEADSSLGADAGGHGPSVGGDAAAGVGPVRGDGAMRRRDLSVDTWRSLLFGFAGVAVLAVIACGIWMAVENERKIVPVGEVTRLGYEPAHSETTVDARGNRSTRYYPEQYAVWVKGEASTGKIVTKWYIVDSVIWHGLQVGQIWQTPDSAGR
jgi:hypothetical protein